MSLTDATINKVAPRAKPVKLSAGNGLWLEVRPSGRKFWRYRYRLNQKETMFTAGEYCRTMQGEHPAATAARLDAGCYTVAEAIAQVSNWRATVESGARPTSNYRQASVTQPAPSSDSFNTVFMEWAKPRSNKWSASYLRDVQSVFNSDILPAIGSIPIKEIGSSEILSLLRSIEDRGAHAVANNARQWISAVFNYGIATLRVESNPTLVLRGALTLPKTTHHKDMSRKEVGELLLRLQSFSGLRQTAIAVELLLVTFVRTNELRYADWEEIDLDRAEWRIPATRMKARRPHVVPLSSRAITLLKELRALTRRQTGLLFSGRTGAALGYNTINNALDQIGFGVNGAGFSAHGFRSTASTILNESGFLGDAIERQLAHVQADTTRASYNHGDLMDVRRSMMQAWSDMLEAYTDDAIHVREHGTSIAADYRAPKHQPATVAPKQKRKPLSLVGSQGDLWQSAS